MGNVSKVITGNTDPFPRQADAAPWLERDVWPASWITVEKEPSESFASAFQLCFNCEEKATISLLVTADQRYQLFLDGQRIGCGPERGVPRKWFYESYEVTLDPGEHCLHALCWFITDNMPWAQATVRPGFLLAVPDSGFTQKISTGLAPWQGQILENLSFLNTSEQVGREIGGGARVCVTGLPFQEFLRRGRNKWAGVKILAPGNNAFLMNTDQHSRILYPGTLPAMRQSVWSGAKVAAVRESDNPAEPFSEVDISNENCLKWQQMLDSGCEVTVPAGQSRQVLIDLDNYVCAYYMLEVRASLGASVNVAWAERLSVSPNAMKAPADRYQVEGRFFVGTHDRFEMEETGRAVYEPLWWQAGRWVLLTITAADKPLTISSFVIMETGYPLEETYEFSCDDSVLNAVAPVTFRTLRACSHETYMDCPYWEQLQYIADTRLQALISYVTGNDSRLAQKALDIFSYSITGASPFMSSSYPARHVSTIGPFSLSWVCMLHDHALWRPGQEIVREMLPCAWWIIDNFLVLRDADGLVHSPKGWNYIDACFSGQEPPGGNNGGVSGPLNWQLVLALIAAGELSRGIGETELADRAMRLAGEISNAVIGKFWDNSRRCLADDLEHRSYSEHSQCLALLSGMLPADLHRQSLESLLTDPDLLRVLPYFAHYLCEVMADNDEGQALVDRLGEWKVFLDAGFHTFPEHGVTGRSDCHAWNAHPLYHMLRSILGIRPACMGFKKVLVRPCPGPLKHISGSVPHPKGEVSVCLDISAGGLSAKIRLPEDTSGEFQWQGKSYELEPGSQIVEL